MKKIIGLSIILAVMLVFGFTFAGCGDSGTTPQTVTYTGTANGITYTLKITQNINSRSVYAPAAGDGYELTVGNKKSTGTVFSFTGGVLILQPSAANAEPFTAVLSGSSISDLTGTITFDDETVVAGPGPINGGNNNGDGGIFVLTGIPEEYNGKYAFFQTVLSQYEVIYGCQSMNWSTEDITFVQISNGGVSLPMWYFSFGALGDSTSKYTGNDTFTYSEVVIHNSSTNVSSFGTLAVLVFQSITFSNGNAAKSWNDGAVLGNVDD